MAKKKATKKTPPRHQKKSGGTTRAVKGRGAPSGKGKARRATPAKGRVAKPAAGRRKSIRRKTKITATATKSTVKASAKPAPPTPPVAIPDPPTLLHLLSDSTGNLAMHMATAFVTQFAPGSFHTRPRNFLDTPAKLSAALEMVSRERGLVMHALVSPGDKAQVNQHCDREKLAVCDLTGKFVDFLAKTSGRTVNPNVRALHIVGTQYHRRIKALEFTIDHDDALGIETVSKADIILAGVSRTSKTPTSIYLAQQGYRVANVALAMEVAPPVQLLAADPKKVVGLVIDPRQLVEIRTNRSASWRMGDTSYNDVDHVQREVQWSRRLFITRGWHILDVTDQAIEETAARIVSLVNPNG